MPDFEQLRQQGREDAQLAATTHAPADLVERVAWAQGWGQEDQLRSAVDAARAAGVSWGQLGQALGMARGTVETKYGRGYERQKAYRERKRRGGDDAPASP